MPSQNRRRNRLTRRRFLAATTTGLVAPFSGCLGILDERQELRDRVASLKAEIESLESELQSEQSRVESLEAEIERLEADLASKDRAQTDLQQEVDALEAEVEAYQRQLEAWNIWGFSEAELEQLQQLASTWHDSIVAIDVFTHGGGWGVGTGWIFDERVVATNAHVARPYGVSESGSVDYDVWTKGGQRFDASLLGYTFGEDETFDDEEDVAFLEVSSQLGKNRIMPRGRSRDLTADEPLLQIGHPWSVDYWTPSVGPFVEHREPFYESNVPGQPGVSGSPIIDLDGDVVGMTWGGHFHRVPQRSVGEAPPPGDDAILTTFEQAVHGIHSYMHRIETAYDALA